MRSGFRITNPFSPSSRWAPNNAELKKALGLPEKYNPNQQGRIGATFDGYLLDGTPAKVPVYLLDPQEAKALHPRSQKPRRLHAQCPSCKRLVCAGHTTQHRCK